MRTHLISTSRLSVILALVGVLAPQPAFGDRSLPLLAEDFQVLQRDSEDKAVCLINVDGLTEGEARFDVRVTSGKRTTLSVRAKASPSSNGASAILVENIPVGGPYTVSVQSAGAEKPELVFRNILVGDLWILGGQSNMYGLARIEEDLPALPRVNLFDFTHIHRTGSWCAAKPPIHRIPDMFAPGILKSQRPGLTNEQVKQILADKIPVGGTDCSYFFARQLVRETGVPIGLIPCAMGGSLALWDPDERDKNRYGFLYHHVLSNGGRVKGMLWYQGEQDAIFGDETETIAKPSPTKPYPTYGDEFKKFDEAMRQDFDNPKLVVLLAQICRHHGGEKQRDKAWETVRDLQRRLPEQIAHVHCVPTIDLDVMDGIHLDYASHKRLGKRMAYLAIPYTKTGVAPRTEIRLKSVETTVETGRPALAVEFNGVTGRLRAEGKPTGFRLRSKESGDDLNWIYKVDFDPQAPNRLILNLSRPPSPAVALVYGSGSCPYVNITDENDMPVPAFGPIDVPLP